MMKDEVLIHVPSFVSMSFEVRKIEGPLGTLVLF